MVSVGQELLDVPLPDMVTKLALGIAEAQKALDTNSVATAKELAGTKIDVVPALTQVIAADGSVSFTAADASGRAVFSFSQWDERASLPELGC